MMHAIAHYSTHYDARYSIETSFKVTEHLWVLILPKFFLLVSMKALD
jgi:hypothetical protein